MSIINTFIQRAIILTLCFFSAFVLNAKELDKVSLQLQWKDQFQFAGYYVAKEKGFYEEAGLDVEIKKFDFGIVPSDEVVSGRATYGVGRSSLIYDRYRNKPVVILAAILQSSPNVLLTRSANGIHSIKDLKNKRTMMTIDSLEAVSIQAMLISNGIIFNDLTVQKHSFDPMDLINNNTDIMSSYVSNEPFILKENGFDSKIFDPRDYGFDFYDDILFTSDKEIKNNKERADRFLKASLRGWQYAFDNIKETVALIKSKYNIQNKSRKALQFEAKELKKLAFYKTYKLGKVDKVKLERINDIYKATGFIKGNVDIDSMVYDSSLNEINLTDEEINYLKTKKTLKIHNEMNWPPFNFNIDQRPQGYSIGLMNLIAKKLGIEIEYISGPTWKQFLTMIKNNEIDVMLNIVSNEKRKEYLSFTEPYKIFNQLIYCRNSDFYHSLDDLKGKTVAVVRGFAGVDFLEKYYPDIKLLKYNNSKEMFKAVSYGKADALVAISPVANQIMIEEAIFNIVPRGEAKHKNQIQKNIPLAIAVNKNNKILRDILQKALENLDYEDLAKLDIKWFGKVGKDRVKSTVLSKKEMKYLADKGNIKMCIDPDWMPYEKIEKGRHIGFTKDIFDIFENNIGVKFELVATKSWDESLKFAKMRKCDILSCLNETPERKKYLNFTTSMYIEPEVMVTKSDVPFLDGIASLSGKKVGLVKGYVSAKTIENKFPDIEIVYIQNKLEGLKKVSNGEIFAAIDSLTAIAYDLSTKGFYDLKISGKTELTNNFKIGIRNDDKILLSIMQKAVDSLSETQKNNILNKWMNVTYNDFDYRSFWQYGLAIIIILIALVYRQYILQKHNNALEDARMELEHLIDTTMEGLFIWEGHKCVKVNDSALEITGYETQEEVFGKPISHFVSDESMPEVIKNLELPEGDSYEITAVKKDGSTFPALVKGHDYQLKNKNMRVTAVIDLTNIKEQTKKLELANKKIQEKSQELKMQKDVFESLYQQSNDGVTIIQDNILMDCNKSVLQMLKYDTKEEVLGLHPAEISPIYQPDGALSIDKAQKMEEIALNKGFHTFEWVFKKSNGEEFWADIVMTKIISAGSIVLHVVWRDITDRKDMEHEINILNKNLEKRVKEEVAKNIEKDKILNYQSRLAQMGEMISMIAHQWRQPLAIIASAAIGIKMKMALGKFDLAKEDKRKEFNKYLDKQLTDIEKFVQNLTLTIDDFRNFYKPNKKTSRINIAEASEKALDIIEASLCSKGINIIKEYNSKKTVELYKNELMQVIINILKNSSDNFEEKSIKNGTIKLTTQDIEKGVELTICDNGGGINNDIIDNIFDPYFSTKDEKNGTGIGLYMSKMIIEKHHNGKLGVQNHDEGVCFKIALREHVIDEL